MASICARFSGGMFFKRSLMSGAFWPLTSRSMWTCHSPGLIGGGLRLRANARQPGEGRDHKKAGITMHEISLPDECYRVELMMVDQAESQLGVSE